MRGVLGLLLIKDTLFRAKPVVKAASRVEKCLPPGVARGGTALALAKALGPLGLLGQLGPSEHAITFTTAASFRLQTKPPYGSD